MSGLMHKADHQQSLPHNQHHTPHHIRHQSAHLPLAPIPGQGVVKRRGGSDVYVRVAPQLRLAAAPERDVRHARRWLGMRGQRNATQGV